MVNILGRKLKRSFYQLALPERSYLLYYYAIYYSI